MPSTVATLRPLIVPIFVPHGGCPHQCLFCNQKLITRTQRQLPDTRTLRQVVQDFLGHSRDKDRFVQLAFYGGNFLGLPHKDRIGLMQTAQQLAAEGLIHGIRFSTRPDTITPQSVEWLRSFNIVAVELGVQSMAPDILDNAHRGHTVSDTIQATQRLQTLEGVQIGHQLMLGLPGDTEETALDSGRQIAALGPDFVRLYPTLVLTGSPLALTYRQGRYQPWGLTETVQVAKQLYRLFQERGIRIIRMGLQPGEDLIPGQTVLAGPHHPAFGELVQSALWLDGLKALLEQQHPQSGTWACDLYHHPRDESAIRGQRQQNLKALRRLFPTLILALHAHEGIPRKAFSLLHNTPTGSPAKAIDPADPSILHHRDSLHLQ